ncbi:MAG: esterase/lipase family protein, partial [Planctomycetota bacterium]
VSGASSASTVAASPGDTGAPGTPAGPAPINGWPCPEAPNGRLLPSDLGRIEEDALLRHGGRAALYAVGDGAGDYHPERPPLVLVHGLNGDPDDLQSVVDRYEGGPYQVYVLAYDDNGRRTGFNGDDLANELRGLSQTLGPGREVRIVGHSMGGIVARRALNELSAGRAGGIERFGKVQLYAIDTPWHGFDGPADRGIGRLLMGLVRPFMPDGLEDMRAESEMFTGDPDDANPARRLGLFGVSLPDNVEVDLVFAASGDQARDFSESPLNSLPDRIVQQYQGGTPIGSSGPTEVRNFWRALVSSTAFPAMHREIVGLKREGRLDADTARAALERHFPRLPGDHVSVLAPHPGETDALTVMDRRFRRP